MRSMTFALGDSLDASAASGARETNASETPRAFWRTGAQLADVVR